MASRLVGAAGGGGGGGGGGGSDAAPASIFANYDEALRAERLAANQVQRLERKSGQEGFLSSRSRAFASKLKKEFYDFHEGLEGNASGPMYTTADLSFASTFHDLLVNKPHDTVNFKRFVFNHKQARDITAEDRRLNRVANTAQYPLSIWAHNVLQSSWFGDAVIAVIFINAVALGLQTVFTRSSHPEVYHALEKIDLVSMLVFITEIALMWTDNFARFWRSNWNIFDFAVTLMGVVPNLITFIGGHSASTGLGTQLRMLRTLRLLKTISRVGNLRIIFRTIIDAFRSMAFILLLLLLIAYLFSIFAINLFADYSRASDPSLKYNDRFSNLLHAFISLFQIMTLDHWNSIAAEARSYVNPVISTIFFVGWVWIGAFIFRNVFIGVMVRNFQEVSAELYRRAVELRKKRMMRSKMKQLTTALANQKLQEEASKADSTTATKSKMDEQGTLRYQKRLLKAKTEWEKVMATTMIAIESNPRKYRWPQDCLFLYCSLMCELQENLEAQERLEFLAAAALNDITEAMMRH